MPASKNILIPLSMVLTLILTGCDLPKPRESSRSGGASFTIERIEGSWGESDYHPSFSVPSARLLNLKVCLKDLARSRPLSGQEFEVVEASSNRVADAQGCVSWSERIEFDYLADSAYLQLDRTLAARGLARGSVIAHIGINPWMHGEPQLPVVDLDKVRVDNLLQGEVAQSRLRGQNAEGPARRRLWLEDGRMLVTDDRLVAGGFNITYQITGVPRLILTRMNGERHLEPLSRGRFDIDVLLIHQDLVNGREVRRVFGVQQLSGVEMVNDQLPIRAPFLLPEVPRAGQLFIGLRIKPLDAPAGLEGFTGVYPIGDYRNIRTGGFIRISALAASQPNFSIESFVTERETLANVRPLVSPSGERLTPLAGPSAPSSMATDLLGQNPHYQRASVEIEHLQFTPLQRGREQGQNREIRYRIKACLRSGVDQETLTARPFQVTLFRTDDSQPARTLRINTDNTSCLYWDESHEYNTYQCQRYVRGFVEIRNDDLGLNQRVEYFMNPWEFDGHLALDARDIARTQALTLECQEGRRLSARLHLDNYTFSTVSYDYDVDQGLNLSVRKRVLFRAEPQVLIYTSLSRGIEERRALRDGPYLLRLLVLRNKDYDSENTYVTHADRLINVIGGRISAEVDLSTADLKAMGNRNTLVVQIHAADPEKIEIDSEGRLSLKSGVSSPVDAILTTSELTAPAFRGNITLNQESHTGPLEVVDQSQAAQLLAGQNLRGSPDPTNWLDQLIRRGLETRATQLSPLSRLEPGATYARQRDHSYIAPSSFRGTLSSLAQGLKVTAEEYVRVSPALLFRPNAWTELKRDAQGEVTAQDIHRLVRGEIDVDMAKRLCLVYAYEILGDRVRPAAHRGLVHGCWRRILRHGANQVFAVSRREMVHGLTRAEFVGGVPTNLSVASAFSIAKAESESFTIRRTVGVNGGLNFKKFDFLSVGISGGMSLDWATSESETATNAISVTENAYLSVRETRFRLHLSAVEKCAIIRLHPRVFARPSFWQLTADLSFLDAFRADLEPVEVAEAAQRALMVCSENVERAPQVRQESYYLIYQDAQGGDVQDSGDARNRPFFVALRGHSDYRRFVNLIRGTAQTPPDADASTLDDTYLIQFLEAHFSQSPASPGHLILEN